MKKANLKNDTSHYAFNLPLLKNQCTSARKKQRTEISLKLSWLS